jgi:hypothetical protein
MLRAKLLISLLCCCLLGFVSSPAYACPNLAKARALYSDGKADEALSALRCLEKAYPRDLDVKRLISDIYWWQGNVDEAVSAAREGEKLKPWDEDPDTAIHLAERTRPWRLTASGDEVWGDQQNGTEFFGLLDYRFSAFLGSSEIMRTIRVLTIAFFSSVTHDFKEKDLIWKAASLTHLTIIFLQNIQFLLNPIMYSRTIRISRS